MTHPPATPKVVNAPRAEIGGLVVVESGSLLLVLEGHPPQLASHFTVRGEMGLARASRGKFAKRDAGGAGRR